MKKEKGRPKRKDVMEAPFEIYRRSLPEAEQEKLALFFDDIKNHVMLAKGEVLKIRTDFENALLYYSSAGLSLDDALDRLSVSNLGGFYARPPVLWYKLDDAAKIFPLSMRHGQMSVFRLSIYLKQDIVPEILQMSLNFTIKRFPSFATTVKKGFFWHYLDASKRRYAVELESGIPCRPLKISRSASQSFRVVYFHNRVSIEYFHVLTDGTGGMIFLKTLIAEYLHLLGTEWTRADGVLNINDIPSEQETANEFLRAGKAEKMSGYSYQPALQMSGKISKIQPCRILHFRLDASRLKDIARSKNVTVTSYILALLFVAGKSATDEPKGCISIQVPVNMRKYYPSETLRNFSLYCGIRLPADCISDTESIIENISEQLKQETSLQSMSRMMASTKRMNELLRFIPLSIKSAAARNMFGFLGDSAFSNTLSNLGVVKMPPQMAQQIDSMDFMLGGSCGMITFENTTTLSVAKRTADPSFEEKLYDLFAADGIIPVMEGSELYEC